ncbi:MAG: hypothetical protein ACT4O9_14345 [Blastocatellia bacterium]
MTQAVSSFESMPENISTPARVFFAFTFFAQVIALLYEAWALEPPTAYLYLLYLAHASILWWWLKEDSRKTGGTWPMDLGYFIYLAWPVLIPYHLFTTRGLRGFIGIFGYVAAILAGWLTAVLVVQIYLWLYL